ncbi:aldo/keto reductase [Rhodalgimonas zhirmunskyi]|uniref:Aldo/keto reductase n=1 Tax=Rhodalgimonas zhirmunskyi TaxID=2964767 RepID=A0AAJ1X7G5_9RHOB|nr:aldo/keto reductase [Rhodoalgimonas zhirmunskyi]MDQ2095679.1 aldo/keto reductase [Rhodoalgimonas zhirmunskyi]
MKRVELGRSGIEVSDLCLGSMTWGTQTAPEDGHAQIERALEAGIDFIDTAHMYPVNPVSGDTIGRTEEIIGDWFTASGRRAEVVLATKHLGEGSGVMEGGTPEITSETIPAAIEGSLKRLRTDVIDLYQFHWPNRGSYHFRRNWRFDPSTQDTAKARQHFEDALGALAREVERGTIRAFGLSNESAWGMAQWLAGAERGTGPRAATIQNEYSLLNRLYDTDLGELGHHEDVTLLAFSPLAAGLLTGKYQDGGIPEGSRRSYVENLGGRMTERVLPAVAAYLELASKHGLDPVQMALAFVRQRPFPAIPIFGATTMAQLENIIAGKDLILSDEVLEEIDAVHKAHPLPY